MVNPGVEGRPALRIHEKGVRQDEGGKVNTTGYIEHWTPGHGFTISHVDFSADRLPFADHNLKAILPHRGLINAREIRRVNDPQNTSVYTNETNPFKRGLNTIVNSMQHNQESLSQLTGLAEECQLRGLLPDNQTMENFVKEVFTNSDTKWLTVDINSTYVQFLTAWLIVNPFLAKVAFDNGSDFISSSLSATALAYFGSTAVKETYLAARFFGIELGQMIQSVRRNQMSEKDFKDNLKIYALLFVGNLIPTASYALSAGYSFPRNKLVTKTFSRLLAAKSSEFGEQTLSKVREFLGRSTPNPFTEFNEYYLAQIVDEQRRMIAESSYPILTASVLGNLDLDDEIQTLSRAHWTMAYAMAQFMKSGSLTVIDMANYLPRNDKKKLWFVGNSARRAARSPKLAWLREHTEFLSRRLLPLESILKDNVEYFMEELVKKKGRPITTFHYAIGNCVIDYLEKNNIHDIPVIHYITDPHVHPTYLKHKDLSYVYYFTFDEGTRNELIANGVPSARIRVTGFPINKDLKVDYTNEEIEEKYKPKYGEKLNVAIFSGGLGGNQEEILQVAHGLDYRTQTGVYYCGTNHDLAMRVKEQFDEDNKSRIKQIKYKFISAKDSSFFQKENGLFDAVIVVGDSLDELVPVSYDIFNWAHVVASKPSGDVGLEALLSGKIFIPFRNLAEHEMKIRNIIQSMGAVFDIDDLSNIGIALRKSYARGELLQQAKKLQINLKNNPPFPRNWQQEVELAMAEIEGRFIRPIMSFRQTK